MTGRAAVAILLLLVVSGCRRRGGSPSSSEVPPGPAAAVIDAAGEEPEVVADGPAAGPEAVEEEPPPPDRGCDPAGAARFPTEPDPAGGTFGPVEAEAALPEGEGAPKAVLETSVGTIECTLDARGAPLTTASFVGLATGRRPWWDPCRGEWVREPMFDGMAFHRLEAGFVAQSGCPIGDGTGGPGYVVADEFRAEPRHDAAGVLTLANLGPGTAGSQFAIMLGPAPQLDRRQTIFGRCGPEASLAALERAAAEGTDVRILRVRLERDES